MKKTNHKKIIITSLVSLCLAALAGTYFLTRPPENKFVPAATEKSEPTESWDERSEPDTDGSLKNAADSTQATGTPKDNTQTVVVEDETGSTVNLTDTQSSKDAATEKPSEKPVATEDAADPKVPPKYDDSVPQAEPETASTPAPSVTAPDDSSSHEGEVFVPGFGWVTPSNVEQDTIDSDGDINKQIGTMGGR